ncbi:SGNH/GDSL hydrolase family protein [Naumannella sp. ID2617S]|nr:SGNH/GDSL hydrolase family protein [Naumannella sp. ID2617S]
MSATKHLRRAAAAGAIVALGTLAGFTPALADTTNDYVALGDSYSAGDGGGDYIIDGTICFRSPNSFAGQLAAKKGLELDLQACSGAVTADMPKQYPALSTGTDFVTLTVGGNDVGFAPVVIECMKPSWWGNCDKAVNEAEAKGDNVLPAKLASVYAAVKSRAPRAKIVVAGYPRLFNGQDCSWVTFFTAHEMERMNNAADRLNAQIKKAATSAGLTFVDVTQPFMGHAICDSQPYLHNVTALAMESFHPNTAGYTAYANAISPALGSPSASLATRAYADNRKTATVRDSSTGKSVRARLGGANANNPLIGRVQAPDLNSAEARAAARRAGVSDQELQTLASGQDKALKGQQVTRGEADALRRAKG